MRTDLATASDIPELARLLWLDTLGDEPTQRSADAFAEDLGAWWSFHRATHSAFVARAAGPEAVGMAWVAMVPRVPRPGATTRLSADLQSVFVMPQHRGRGIGSALIRAACEHAVELGATRVTVHSGRRAVPVYQRLGFEPSHRLLQRPPD